MLWQSLIYSLCMVTLMAKCQQMIFTKHTIHGKAIVKHANSYRTICSYYWTYQYCAFLLVTAGYDTTDKPFKGRKKFVRSDSNTLPFVNCQHISMGDLSALHATMLSYL